MSVLFDIVDANWPRDPDGCALPPAPMYVNLSNVNARAFLEWIGLDSPALYGEIPARELAAILRRRLWPSRRHHGDEGESPQTLKQPGRATFINGGRAPGKLAAYAERLLALAEFAQDGTIAWS